jgi:hypothetical protein
MKVCWFSCGVSSFVACYLAKDIDKNWNKIRVDFPEVFERRAKQGKDRRRNNGRLYNSMPIAYMVKVII